MDYREIVAVTGIGGLYQLVTSKGDGAIVRALADGKTVFVSARKHQVTPIESIEIYTTGDNVRLHEVLQKMKAAEAETPLPATKDQKEVAQYFSTVFPEYDRDRVYPSDLKKLVKWYGLLKSADLLDFSRYEQEEAEDALANEEGMPLEGKVQVSEHNKDHDVDEEAASQSVEGGNLDVKDASAKKARTKKATDAPAEGEEAPKKATRAKKATDAEGEGEEAPKKTTRKKKTDDEA